MPEGSGRRVVEVLQYRGYELKIRKAAKEWSVRVLRSGRPVTAVVDADLERAIERTKLWINHQVLLGTRL